MRRTRILATIGPASDSPEMIAALIDAGVDAFRLNFSHGTTDDHRAVLERIRRVAAGLNRAIAVVQDLAGPKIRIGALQAPLLLASGDSLTIQHGEFMGGAGRVACSADALFQSVGAGARLLVDDGRIELDVVRATATELDTRVVVGGLLDSHKGINVPGVMIQTPALTANDRDDLRAGIAMGVDLAAVSFVQSAEDMRLARAAAAGAGAPDLPLIAKIEKPQAVDDLEGILDVCDGLMVARGDLGVEMPLESVPAVQRAIIRAARRRGSPVIVATQVLESMREAPRPTRAEVTDAAHAVDQGADAIMLAGETAVGRYPRDAVRTLDRILREAERSAPPDTDGLSDLVTRTAHGRALCQAAVTLADRAKATAIVAVTGGGQTARMLSGLRPRARILAVTPSAATAARLALTWGVVPIVIPDSPDVADVRRALMSGGHLSAGDLAVFVSVSDALANDKSNFVHVEAL
jgi:pyruvate kinase